MERIGPIVESIGQTGLLVGAGVIVVLVLVLVVLFISRRGRRRRSEEQRERTREEFGSEYERAEQEQGSGEGAERELRQRRGRMERQVQPLSEEDRRRYEEQWGEIERIFVDNPGRSLEMADRTVSDLLDQRNVVTDPAQSDDETQKSLGALHPEVADDYREARRIRAGVVGRSADEESGATTDEMREGIRCYRSVYEKLTRG